MNDPKPDISYDFKILRNNIPKVTNSSNEIDNSILNYVLCRIYIILDQLEKNKADKPPTFEDTLVREDSTQNCIPKTISVGNNQIKDTTEETFPSLVAKVITYEKEIERLRGVVRRQARELSELNGRIASLVIHNDCISCEEGDIDQ